MLIKKAKTFGEQNGIKDFSYSNGWLNRFKKWQRITLQNVCRESAAAADLVDVSKGRKDLQ